LGELYRAQGSLSLEEHASDLALRTRGAVRQNEESMINGMHVIIYSRDAEADRDFIREVLGFPSVDAGGGWLIFAAPPSELACHPAENNDKHELYLICDNVEKEMERLKQSRIKCGPISREQWGLLTTIELPGGGRLGLYEPRHPRPPS